MLSDTRTFVLAVTLAAAPMAYAFAVGDSQSGAASPHTAFPPAMTDSGTRDGLTDSGAGNSSYHSTRLSHR